MRNEQFVFHASSVDYMNDSAEYSQALKHCSDFVDEKLMEIELGTPFAFCFSEKSDSVPMWNMYAKNGKGVCLKFCFSKLKKHFDQLKEKDKRFIKFDKCGYRDYIPKEDDKPLCSQPQHPNITELVKKMTEDAFIKPKCFSHEKEWRLMVWQSWIQNGKQKMLFKERQDELCPYLEIPVAVECLEGIILGPGASEQMIEATKLLRSQYGGNGVSVEVSDITLKV